MPPGTNRWSDRESAYMLNYLDSCIQKGVDFKTTVSAEISNVDGREIALSSVLKRLTYMFKHNGTWTTLSDVVKNGTSQLNLSRLPSSILEAMKQQRATFELEELNLVDTGNNSAGVTTEAEHNSTHRVQRKVSTRARDDSQKSYREETVGDSDASDDRGDGDFGKTITKQPKQKLKTHLRRDRQKSETTPLSDESESLSTAVPPIAATSPVNAQSAAVKRKSHEIDTDDQPTSLKRQVLEGHVAPPVLSGALHNSHKRKSDVTDQGVLSTSPKRQALDSDIAAPSFNGAVNTSLKRKTKVVYLDGDSQSPPPKRQAQDIDRESVPSKTSVASSHGPPANQSASLSNQIPAAAKKTGDPKRGGRAASSKTLPPAARAARTKSVQPAPVATAEQAQQSAPTEKQQANPKAVAKDATQVGIVPALPVLNAQQAQQPNPPSATAEGWMRDWIRDWTHFSGVLLHEYASSGREVSKDQRERISRMATGLEKQPGQLFERILSDLDSMDRTNKELRELLRDLIGHREFNKRDREFPRAPKKWDMDDAWWMMRKKIQNAFGYGYSEELPKEIDVGYIASRIDFIAKDGPVSLGRAKDFIEELAPYLENPHLAHSIVSALFCRWLFSGPEPMCKDVYSDKEMEMYKAVLKGTGTEDGTAEGASEVQYLDKLGLKLLFENEDFKKSSMRTRAEKLIEIINKTFKCAWSSAPGVNKNGGSPEDWAHKSLKIKQDLMISPMDYRLHFCRPGTTFNPDWMRAEDSGNWKVSDADAASKKVVCCLFPALVEQDPEPFEMGIQVEALLARNKKFFPSFQERQNLDPKRVISKACVLVA